MRKVSYHAEYFRKYTLLERKLQLYVVTGDKSKPMHAI